MIQGMWLVYFGVLAICEKQTTQRDKFRHCVTAVCMNMQMMQMYSCKIVSAFIHLCIYFVCIC